MRVEEDMGPVAPPAELFARFQAIKPYLGDGMLRPATQSERWCGPCEGVYTCVDHSPCMTEEVCLFDNIIILAKLKRVACFPVAVVREGEGDRGAKAAMAFAVPGAKREPELGHLARCCNGKTYNGKTQRMT